MGSGKSTIGQILADRLSMSWFDMDEVIENQGMKIPKIFEQYGEAKFREIETEVTYQMAKETSSVVSTGGGVVLKPQNVETMQTSGHVVYLKASQKTLLRNLESGRAHRPLIKDGSLELKIKDLLDKRGQLYISSASLVVETDEHTPSEIADMIVNLLNL